MKTLVAGALLLVSGVAPAADTPKVMPDQFLGEWGADRESCLKHNTDSVDTDTLEMHIEPSRISFYESTARVLAVVTSGKREIALIVEMSSQGDTWLSTLEFELSADMKSIKDVSGRKYSPMRVRC